MSVGNKFNRLKLRYLITFILVKNPLINYFSLRRSEVKSFEN